MTTMVAGPNSVHMENFSFVFFGLLSASQTSGTPTSTQFTVLGTNESFAFTGVGFGGFVSGIPTVGTVTGLVNIKNGVLEASFTNMNIPVAQMVVALANGDWSAFVTLAFGGNDTITGSDFDFPTIGSAGDTLVGWNGDDVIFGGGGDDTLFGDADPTSQFVGVAAGNDEIHGGQGKDVINDGSGNDSMFGDEGDDQITSSGGVDTIDGGAGNDFITINRSTLTTGIIVNLAGAATAEGATMSDGTHVANAEIVGVVTGSGNDTFNINSLTSSYGFTAGAGTDRIVADLSGVTTAVILDDTSLRTTAPGGFGVVSLAYNSVEVFTVSSGVGDDTLAGAAGDDVLDGGAGSDRLTGNAGHDILRGGEGADLLDGGAGDDTLLGGAGDDVLGWDGQGADIIDGGDGVDLINIGFSPFAGTMHLGFGDVVLANGTELTSIEMFGSVSFGNGDDSLRLTAIPQRSGTVNDGSYFGGGGVDTLVLDLSTSTDSVSTVFQAGPNPALQIFNGSRQASASAFEIFVISGGSASDTLNGGSGNDTLSGGGGDDSLNGGDGDDIIDDLLGSSTTITGGAGADSIRVGSSFLLGTVDGGLGVDELIASGNFGGLSISGIEILSTGGATLTATASFLETFDTIRVSAAQASATVGLALSVAGAVDLSDELLGRGAQIAGSLGDDVIITSNGSDVIDGGFGDDVLSGGLGADTLIGGGGFDTASYTGATAGVSVNLTLVGAQNTLSAGVDTLTGIENLIGSAFNDVLTGDDNANVLTGGVGVDTLTGGGGNDTLVGGDNSDFIVDLSGIVAIDAGTGNDQITLGAAVIAGAIDGGAGTDQLTKGGSIAGLTLTSIEILNTNGGTVTATAEQFEAFDTIRFSIGQPFTAVSLALAATGTVDLVDELLNRRALFAGTSGNDVITTSNGSDQIEGGDGDDILTGNAGVDTLIGGLGNDALNGGDGIDFLVDLSGTVAVDGGDGDDVITLGAAIAAGSVDGGLGIDQLNKGGAIAGLTVSGIEIVNTNGGTLLATAAQLESFDTIRFSAAQAGTAVSLALSEAGTVDLVDELLGRRALFAGSSGNDVITTSNGSDQVDGGDGNDVLTGNAGVDTLIGGLGDDVLNGGDGGDFLVDLSGIVSIDAGDGDDVLTVGAGITTGSIAGGLGTADQLNKSGNLSGITVSGIEIVNTNGGTLTATAAQLESFDVIRFSAANATGTISLAQAGAGTVDLTDEVLGRRVLYQGSAGNDVVTLSDGADRLDGAAGNDTLNGGLGNDTLLGGLGDDLITQGSTDGRDIIDGGAGTDTYQLNGTAAAETFRIMTRAEAVLAGITGLAGSTEIVITRNGTDTASVIAELDNVEEIQVNTLLTTADNGNGTVDGGAAGGDTVIVTGDFTATSLAYSTIHVLGSSSNDTVDISGLSSAHRIVFDTAGGDDTVIGTLRPQDVVNTPDSLASDPVLLQMILGEEPVAKPGLLHDPGLVSPVETFGLEQQADVAARVDLDQHRADGADGVLVF